MVHPVTERCCCVVGYHQARWLRPKNREGRKIPKANGGDFEIEC